MVLYISYAISYRITLATKLGIGIVIVISLAVHGRWLGVSQKTPDSLRDSWSGFRGVGGTAAAAAADAAAVP